MFLKNKSKIILFILLIMFFIPACQFLNNTNNATEPKNNFQGIVSLEENLTGLYEQLNQGIVSINVFTETSIGSGSGFVIDKEGHIATNLHVVQDALEIHVSFPSGIKTRAEIIGEDSDSDIAIIKVDISEDDLIPLPLGDSDDLKVGQFVVAIGNPFGYSGSMTVGIVSSIGRMLSSLNMATNGRPFSAGDIIQTDAAINPGNSGGPLINLDGEVVGINRAIETVNISANSEPINSGIGFAVSVNILKRVAPSLIENGHYSYPYLGVSGSSEMSLIAMEELGFEKAIGVLISNITQDGPAHQAGLHIGDVILSIDGNEIINFGDMIGLLFNNYSPDDIITMEIFRDEEYLEIELTLGDRSN